MTLVKNKQQKWMTNALIDQRHATSCISRHNLKEGKPRFSDQARLCGENGIVFFGGPSTKAELQEQ
jgi:hypothetical protein